MEAEAARKCKGRVWWGLVGNRDAVPIPRSQAVSRGNCHQEGRPTLHCDSTKPQRAAEASPVRPQGARWLTPQKGRQSWPGRRGGHFGVTHVLLLCPLGFPGAPQSAASSHPQSGSCSSRLHTSPSLPGSPRVLPSTTRRSNPNGPTAGSPSTDWQAHRPSPESSWPTSGLVGDKGQESLGC